MFKSRDTDITLLLQEAVAGMFQVEAVELDARQEGTVHLYGRFLVESDRAYPEVLRRFQSFGYTPLFRDDRTRGQRITAVPGKMPAGRANWKLPLVLFLATLLSTLFAGMEWSPGRSVWQNILSGVPFAAGLMTILLAHEMGHYLVGRRLGVPVSLPHFIPFPLPPLGTMGAFIQMKAPPQNRRHLLAVGVAGPLSGLLFAVPLVLLGLSRSSVQPLPATQPSLMEGNSILYGLLKVLLFGRFLPDCSPGILRAPLEILRTALYGCRPGHGEDVFLGPLAFAGWAGLLVTGLNLIPAGQLDGGHVAYALLGRRARYLTQAIIVALVVFAVVFQWWGWLLWAGLIFLLGRRQVPPLDDITRLKPWQTLLACLLMAIFVLTFVPVPFRVIAP
ncbi:MAG: site-2 protease family protein [Chloroflexia bacterium]